jgi:ribonuclease D
MGEDTLMQLVRRAPTCAEDLQTVPGMTPEQIRRHGQGVLHAVQQGLHAPARHAPEVNRELDEVRERYDRLHTWRKERARARGVESDVILPRTALLDLARRAPRTNDELTLIVDLGPWRRETYGEEILTVLYGASRDN